MNKILTKFVGYFETIHEKLKNIDEILIKFVGYFETIHKKLKNNDDRIDALLSAINLTNKIAEIDSKRILTLRDFIFSLEKENLSLKRRVDYLEKNHNIFW
jgi:hypothetical protein